MHSIRARRGLTLADFVVITVLLLTLLGLLLTLLVRQRETAQCVHCADNLRRLSTAVIAFHDASGGTQPAYLPASRIADGYASWAVQIGPHLSAANPLEPWDMRKPYAAQPASVREAMLPVFFCPARLRVRSSYVSDADGTHLPGALGDYAGVAGNDAPGHDWTGPDANGLIILGLVLEKRDDLVLRWRGRVGLDDLKRGRSYTLLLGEKHVPVEQLGQAASGDGSLYDGGLPASCTRIGGPGHGLASDPTAPFHDNFGSYHPGICLFAQADSAVRTLTVNVDETLLGRLTTQGD